MVKRCSKLHFDLAVLLACGLDLAYISELERVLHDIRLSGAWVWVLDDALSLRTIKTMFFGVMFISHKVEELVDQLTDFFVVHLFWEIMFPDYFWITFKEYVVSVSNFFVSVTCFLEELDVFEATWFL